MGSIAEGVYGLLTSHVRGALYQDLNTLKSVENQIQEIRTDASIAQAKIERIAISRIKRLEGSLDRAISRSRKNAEKIRKLEGKRSALVETLERGNLGEWSTSERFEANSAAEEALADSLRAISASLKERDSQELSYERAVKEKDICVDRKNAIEDLIGSLKADEQPEPYLDALEKEKRQMEKSFQDCSRKLKIKLQSQFVLCSTAEEKLLNLREELNSARERLSATSLLGPLGSFIDRIDPRQLFWRSEEDINYDIKMQNKIVASAAAMRDKTEAEINKLKRSHNKNTIRLPDLVRDELITTSERNLLETTERAAEISAAAELLLASIKETQHTLALQEKEHSKNTDIYISNFFSNKLSKTQYELDKVENKLAAAHSKQSVLQVDQERLKAMIDGRNARLEATILAITDERESKISSIEKDLHLIKERLHDRHVRASMLYNAVTDSFEEKTPVEGNAAVRRNRYRESKSVASEVISLEVLIQRRTQTGYVSKDDKRLCSVIASFLGHDEPAEETRPEFIDHFCNLFFGDDDEKRRMFVAVVNRVDENLFVLVRPEKVLPQLQALLPVAMSVCVLCRIEYGVKTRDGSTLYLLDAALVPDCEPRPYEHLVGLLRYSTLDRESPRPPSHSFSELMDQAGVSEFTLHKELDERLEQWTAYLWWAEGQLLKTAPWGVMREGRWENSVWEGLVIFNSEQSSSDFKSILSNSDSPARYELFQLESAWILGSIQSSSQSFRCKSLEITEEEPVVIELEDCPWPTPTTLKIRLQFSDRDAHLITQLSKDTVLGLCNVTELTGSRTQNNRFQSALMQLQGLSHSPAGKDRSRLRPNRLPAAPYLMASIFNVKMAARPPRKPIQMANSSIAESYRLNQEQLSAVEVMLQTPEVAYIQGPPGTGKTTMIAAACAHFVRAGLRVLVSSQTNLAVENVLERLAGDPAIRALWLSRAHAEEKQSNYISEWYRQSSEWTERRICTPYRNLSKKVKHQQTWHDRACRLRDSHINAALDLEKREGDVELARDRLNSLDQIKCNVEDSIRKLKWWTMAYNAVTTSSEWAPSCFTPELKGEAARLLEVLSSHDGKSAHLDVSANAVHRQLEERVRALKHDLDTEKSSESFSIAKGVIDQVVAEWPGLSRESPKRLEEKLSETMAHRSVAEATFLEATQARDDAQSRMKEIGVKSRKLLCEISEIVGEGESTISLDAGIELVGRLILLDEARLSDIQPLEDWLPLLDQWALNTAEKAETASANDHMGERYVKSANVIGITCNSNFKVLSDTGFPRFDVVIIDEVSKATPLELLRPMLLAPISILVGDHRQLPPTFEFQSSRPLGGLATEDEDPEIAEREAELLGQYERLNTASLFRDGFTDIDSRARAALNTQYRMHPQIMSLVNRFYDGRLVSGLPDPDGKEGKSQWSCRDHGLTLFSRTGGQYLRPEHHALWIDSSKDEHGKAHYEVVELDGISNALEVRLVCQVVEDLVNGFAQRKSKKTIAVATFYNRQKRLILQRLKARVPGSRVEVETVDRFQGKEADVVIVSLVRNKNPKKGRLSNKSNPAKFERINVAFSRARDLLVVVGARETFTKFQVGIEPVDGGAPQLTRVYGQIIDDIREAGGFWRAKDILGEPNR
jgi:hypothetical protein